MKTKKFYLIIISFFLMSAAHAQYKISGKVTDSTTRETLPGVNVIVQGTTNGTVTDMDGNYTLSFTLNTKPILVFSMMGYQKKEVEVPNRQMNINVTLDDDNKLLDEIVVIGYGTIKKKDLTGAVSVANTDEMKKISATTVTQALQGQVPGVQVKSSGKPGETGKIYIRGISSMYSDTNPLFIVDGLPTSDTRDFNPADIESVQVLKDASAAAIYGSRAANGVIIITTKKGVSGKSKIELSAKFGVQNTVKRFDLMDGAEWLALQEEKYKNAGQSALFQIADPTINTNWGDEIFQTGFSQDYNVSASGGNKDSNYMISANYFNNKGVVTGPDFERITTRINGGIEKGRIKLQEAILLSTSLSNNMIGSPLTDIIRMPPLIPVKDENGDFALGGYNGAETNGTNPVAQRNYQSSQTRSYRVQGTVNGELRIFDWLKYKINLGLEFNTNISDTKTEEAKWYPNQSPKSKYEETRNHYLKTVIENLLVFDKKFGKHSINAMVGYTEQRENNKSMGGEVYDLLRDNTNQYYWSLSNGTTPALNEYEDPSALRSFLGRIIYDYDNRYFLTASIRRDGSSRFKKGNNYGNFPSVSAAWRISDEKFFEPISNIVNSLKLKASFGILGNEAIGNFKYNSYLNSFIPYSLGRDESFQFGTMPTVLVDSSIRWEEKQSTNIGIEAGFLNNALTIEADYFINRSNHLLAQVPIPMYMGSWGTINDNSTTIWRNAGCIENRGFELSIGYKDYSHPFKYDLKLNLTTLKNKVIELGGDNAPIYGSNTKTEVGRSLGEFFVLKTDGIYQVEDIEAMSTTTIFGAKPRPGDQRYMDMYTRNENNELIQGTDGVINDDDREYVGSPWPKLDFSLNFNASYRDFDFSMYWVGSVDKTVYNSPKYWLYNVGDNGNYAKGYTGWTEENRSNSTPRVYYSENLRGNTDRFIEHISYGRLKSLQIGYTLPASFMKRIGLEKCRFYLNAENLLTLTNYDGLDPEFSGGGVFDIGVDNNSYPNIRTIGCGLQVSF